MPHTPEHTPVDDSAWVAKSIRDVVRSVACPTCGRRAGLPCANLRFTTDVADTDDDATPAKPSRPATQPTARKRRPHYQNYVHATRRKAYAAHRSTPTA